MPRIAFTLSLIPEREGVMVLGKTRKDKTAKKRRALGCLDNVRAPHDVHVASEVRPLASS